jgi:hypothetical protein
LSVVTVTITSAPDGNVGLIVTEPPVPVPLLLFGLGSGLFDVPVPPITTGPVPLRTDL